MKLATKKEIEEIKNLFLLHYPEKKSELEYNNLYQLIIAVMLSAQCTDKRVNVITPKLFEAFPDIESLAKAELENVIEFVKTCSYFNNKAKNMILLAQKVMSEFDGEIPLTQKELMSLNGVGQKTANVVLIEFQDANVMAVDTHVYRTSHRLGLSNATNTKNTEAELSSKFKTDLAQLHQAMVLFGRYVCKAKNPDCENCFLTEFCKTKEQFKAK